jgi:transposase
MLWELSVTDQRYRAVLEVRAGVPVTEVADRYGVSRQSVHAWLRRYRDEGPSGLADRSHKVLHHPWQIPSEVESAVCELRRTHPLVDAPSREEALAWAAKIAVACRCAQEVWELLPDPEQDAMLRQADRRR